MSEVSEKLRTQLERDEGRVDHAYQDSLGFLTIGVGHLIDQRKGGTLPPHIVDELLDFDISQKTAELTAALPWFVDVDPVRQGVLVNMAFNLGVTGLLEFHQTLDAVRMRQFSAAAKYMLDSRWAIQVGERAHRLAAQMESGLWT